MQRFIVFTKKTVTDRNHAAILVQKNWKINGKKTFGDERSDVSTQMNPGERQ